MPDDLYRQRMQQILHMGLSKEQTIAECIASLAVGLDQLHEKIEDMEYRLPLEENE